VAWLDTRGRKWLQRLLEAWLFRVVIGRERCHDEFVRSRVKRQFQAAHGTTVDRPGTRAIFVRALRELRPARRAKPWHARRALSPNRKSLVTSNNGRASLLSAGSWSVLRSRRARTRGRNRQASLRCLKTAGVQCSQTDTSGMAVWASEAAAYGGAQHTAMQSAERH
jgi:hypothetical protein